MAAEDQARAGELSAETIAFIRAFAAAHPRGATIDYRSGGGDGGDAGADLWREAHGREPGR